MSYWNLNSENQEVDSQLKTSCLEGSRVLFTKNVWAAETEPGTPGLDMFCGRQRNRETYPLD
jgi:hypothetical protein